jgi:hypothetical protein
MDNAIFNIVMVLLEMNYTDQEGSAMTFRLGNKNNCASPLLFPIGSQNGLQNIQSVVEIRLSQGQPRCQEGCANLCSLANKIECNLDGSEFKSICLHCSMDGPIDCSSGPNLQRRPTKSIVAYTSRPPGSKTVF